MTWDGTGKDPWLPQRLDARLNISQTERNVRREFWAELSGWLVQTARRVLRGQQPPDLDAVWARAPAWRDSVDKVLNGQIRDAMSSAYDTLLGRGFPWEQRPAVSRYLAEVRNRLVRIPEEVYDLVAGQVSTGVNRGEGIPEIARRVDSVLSTTDSERWPNRATTVARTETIGMLNASRADAFQAVSTEIDAPMEKLWLATTDTRTRDTHRVADGQRVPVGGQFTVGGFSLSFPGDPTGPPQEVIQCVPGDTLVQAPSLRAVMRRWYEGQMLTIRLAGGDQLTITPNHPILRVDGRWVPAGQFVEGDYCVRASLGREFAGQPDINYPPTKISEFYRSARLMSMAQRIPLTPPDLHGDRPHGNVEVVPVHRELALHGKPASDEQVRQFGLSLARTARVGLGGTDRGTIPQGLAWAEVDRLLTPGGVGRLSGGPPLLGGSAFCSEPVGLAGRSDGQAQLVQPARDDLATHVEGVSDSLDALPPVVALDKIVKIDRHSFIGHVYNLDTGRGWYISETIVTRNCRCTMLLVEPGEEVDMSNRQFLGA